MLKAKKFLLIFVLVALMLVPLPRQSAVAFEQFSRLDAQAGLIAEPDTGTILFSHNLERMRPIDGLAKIMTLLLAVEACEAGEADESEILVMSETAWEGFTPEKGTQRINKDDEITFLELMYAAYIGNLEEACNLIAERLAGSVEAFLPMMNARAREIGCENTNYTSAFGHYDVEHYSTALDQFYIYREAMSHPLFTEISGTFRYDVSVTDGDDVRDFRVTNTNSLLNINSKYYYRQCVSGKASSTFESGYSLVAYSESGGLTLIAVVLGSDILTLDDDSTEQLNFTEARRLFEWAFEGFEWRTIVSTSDLIAKAPILYGEGADFVNLRPESTVTLLLRKDIPLDEFKRDIVIYSELSGESLSAPIEAGEVLGEVTLSREGEVYGPIRLIANTGIELHRLEYIRRQIVTAMSSTPAKLLLLALAIIVVLYTGLVIRYNVLRRRRLRRIAEAKKHLVEERRGGTR